MADGETSQLLAHIDRYLPNFRWNLVFDVGANVGEFSIDLAKNRSPKAIYAFEPAPSTFKTFRTKLAEAGIEAAVRPINMALGDAAGEVRFSNVENDKNNSVLIDSSRVGVTVEAITGDAFCQREGVSEIDFLKIDTEGYDLKVMLGFERMLREQAIGMIEAEVSLTPSNTKHVQFETVKSHLQGRGYHLFFIYEPFMDVWFTGRPLLRRCNPVFISERLAMKNLRPTGKFV